MSHPLTKYRSDLRTGVGMTGKEPEEKAGAETPFEKFKELTKGLVHVPKRAVDRRERAQRAKRRLKKN